MKNIMVKVVGVFYIFVYFLSIIPINLYASDIKDAQYDCIQEFKNQHLNYHNQNEIVSEDNANIINDDFTGTKDKSNNITLISNNEIKKSAEKIIQSEEKQQLNEVKSLITKKEGGKIRLGKVEIEIPPRAVKRDTEISITRLNKVESTGELITNVTEAEGG